MGQTMISIGREFGSAGHEIAERLAKHYELPLYDHNLLHEIAKERNLNVSLLEEFDETKRNKFLYRSVQGMNSSPADSVANLQFDFIRERAEKEESFVVVGRCSEAILKEYTGLISIFITGDMDKKLERIIRLYHLPEREARELLLEKDKRRKQYHDSHCRGSWGDCRYYDLTMNSSRLGVDESARILIDYIDTRKNHRC